MNFDPKAIEDSVEAIVGQVDQLADSMANLALTMENIERMIGVSIVLLRELAKMEPGYAYVKYIGDIEITTQLQVSRQQNYAYLL